MIESRVPPAIAWSYDNEQSSRFKEVGQQIGAVLAIRTENDRVARKLLLVHYWSEAVALDHMCARSSLAS